MTKGEISQTEQVKLAHAAVQPLVEAIREAGFECSAHAWGGTAMYRTSGVQVHVTHKGDESMWAYNVRVNCDRDTGAVKTISSKVFLQRTITLRSLNEDNIKKIVQRIEADLAAHTKYADDHTAQEKLSNEWLAQAENDFKDWEIPPYLLYRYDSQFSPHLKFGNFRASPRTVGRYTLNINPSVFTNLTAMQVKSLCVFLSEVLPNVPG